MMIKIGNEYLDFNDSIEVERQAKLFEDIDTTDGDYSYQFELQKTSNNLKLLGFPFPDSVTKLVYHKIICQLISDSGLQMYDGYLRIEGVTDVIKVAFFSGNNNWFGLLSGPLTDVNFSEFDVDQTETNIQAAIFNTEGVVFPVVDNGVLVTRGFNLMKVEDFVAAIYVKTVFKKIFTYHDIKIQGELLEDVEFNSDITLRNGKSQDQIDARSSFVNTTNSPSPHDATYHKMTWTDDSTFPYFDGEQNNFDLANSRYVADVKMKVKVELTINEPIVPGAFGSYKIAFYVNGVLNQEKNITLAADSSSFLAFVTLEAGDILETYVYNDATIYSDPITKASLKITPIFLYKAFGNSIVPNWTQQEYVSNILRMFNVITHYEPVTKTLTFNLFDKIKSKPPIDLSPYISNTEVDYIDFISNYGKRNLLSYEEVDIDDLRAYNISNFFKYSQGVIEADNEFLSDSEDVVQSDFSNPLSYINPVFDMSMERVNIIDLDEEIKIDATGVTNNLGNARFAISEDVFFLSDLVRVSNSTNPKYNGDYMVVTLGAGYIELSGLQFDTDATAEIAKMNFVYNESDDVYIMHHIPLYSVSNFSGNTFIRFENTDIETMATAYFALLNTGRQINDDFKQSLSFGEIQNPLFYQRTIIESYWNLFSRIVNDPVKLFDTVHLPYSIFLKLDFLRPIEVKTLESSNLFYLNRISGYQGSEREAVCELIKIP